MDKLPPSPVKEFASNNLGKIFLAVLSLSIILGSSAGYILASGKKQVVNVQTTTPSQPPKNPQQDKTTFRDFAEGTIQKRPEPKKADEYIEGTHLLVREKAVPVALTSSVVDLSLYEGKKVKVFGETQKAIKEGWLMDVGKVEVE